MAPMTKTDIMIPATPPPPIPELFPPPLPPEPPLSFGLFPGLTRRPGGGVNGGGGGAGPEFHELPPVL